MLKKATALALIASLAACTTYHPIVEGPTNVQPIYEADLAACRQHAEQINPASTAVAGSLLSAIMFASAASSSRGRYNVGRTAAVAGVAGGVGGAAIGVTTQRDIVRRCMAGRGWSVLR